MSRDGSTELFELSQSIRTFRVMDGTRSRGGSLIGAGVAIAIIGLIAALLVGALVGATVTYQGGLFGAEWSTLTEVPRDRADKTFNWLLFLLVFAPTFIVGGMSIVAGVAVNAVTATSVPAPSPAPTVVSEATARPAERVTPDRAALFAGSPVDHGHQPGWYPDPYGSQSAYRFWDGAQWTRDLRD
jgi:hypothetical protein